MGWKYLYKRDPYPYVGNRKGTTSDLNHVFYRQSETGWPRTDIRSSNLLNSRKLNTISNDGRFALNDFLDMDEGEGDVLVVFVIILRRFL
jgi:hypothetical protein